MYKLLCISTEGLKCCIRKWNPNRYFHTLLNYACENSFKKECGLVVDETIMISPIVGSKPPMDGPLIQILIDVGVGGLPPRGTAYF